ncbi:hypothetical protein ECC02_011033 [Trypanosoma cruzi]|uniref:Uncharacterized protein n=1 Tax=Trypanosoma cruzi TaxID=5693 RepID=A0A7J6XP57_TRYCR|nr:hypothetical protein ECC02_011033 [Trypanosoma cruzi]
MAAAPSHVSARRVTLDGGTPPSSPVSLGVGLLSSFRSALPGYAYSQDRWGRTVVPGRSRQNNPPASAHGCRSVAGTGPIRSLGRPCSQSPPATAAFHSGPCIPVASSAAASRQPFVERPGAACCTASAALRRTDPGRTSRRLVGRVSSLSRSYPWAPCHRRYGQARRHRQEGEKQSNNKTPMKGVRQGQRSSRTKKGKKERARRRGVTSHTPPRRSHACRCM